MVTLTAVSWALGCTHAHKVEIAPRDLPTLLDRYRADGVLTLDDDGSPLRVTLRLSPELEIGHACNLSHLFSCSPTLRAPLGSVQLSPDPDDERHEVLTLSWPNPPLREDAKIPLSDVPKATVLLPGYDRPGWRPTIGVGGTVAGAAGAAAISLHWLPQEWLGFELGVLPPYQAPMLGGYLAFRLRPLRRAGFAPFVGWFVNGFTIAASQTTPRVDNDGIGPRLGLDYEIRSAHVILSAEGDLVHPIGTDQHYFGEQGRWVPWGGGAVVYYF